MKNIYYSSSKNSFYAEELKDLYGNEWPTDAVLIDSSYYIELLEKQSEGKMICPDKKGKPIVKERVQDIEELTISIQRKVKKILSDVYIELQPLQFAEQIGDITDPEKEYMFELKKYALIISRLNTQEGFPHKIDWPEKPVLKDGTK